MSKQSSRTFHGLPVHVGAKGGMYIIKSDGRKKYLTEADKKTNNTDAVIESVRKPSTAVSTPVVTLSRHVEKRTRITKLGKTVAETFRPETVVSIVNPNEQIIKGSPVRKTVVKTTKTTSPPTSTKAAKPAKPTKPAKNPKRQQSEAEQREQQQKIPSTVEVDSKDAYYCVFQEKPSSKRKQVRYDKRSFGHVLPLHNDGSKARVTKCGFDLTDLPLGERLQEQLGIKRQRVLANLGGRGRGGEMKREQGTFEIWQGKDVGDLILKYPNAMIQGASQTNSLEMASPKHTPAEGIFIYFNDNTQGPRVALTTLSDTMYRNMQFPNFNAMQAFATKQTEKMFQNGYILFKDDAGIQLLYDTMAKYKNGNSKKPGPEDRIEIVSVYNAPITGACAADMDTYRLVQGGPSRNYTTNQVFSFAMPASGSYGNVISSKVAKVQCDQVQEWILKAAYEGAILCAIENMQSPRIGEKDEATNNNNKNMLILTLVGAGVFRVPLYNIVKVLKPLLRTYLADFPLKIVLNVYGKQDYDHVSELFESEGV